MWPSLLKLFTARADLIRLDQPLGPNSNAGLFASSATPTLAGTQPLLFDQSRTLASNPLASLSTARADLIRLDQPLGLNSNAGLFASGANPILAGTQPLLFAAPAGLGQRLIQDLLRP